MNDFELIISATFFVILTVIYYNTIKNSILNYDNVNSFILAVCVSSLSIYGLNHFMKDMHVILLPYVALPICILLMTMLRFITKYLKIGKDRSEDVIDDERWRR